MSRARHEHEVVVGGLQKKYETEIKVLNEKLDKLNESVKEKVSILFLDFFVSSLTSACHDVNQILIEVAENLLTMCENVIEEQSVTLNVTPLKSKRKNYHIINALNISPPKSPVGILS